MEEGTRGFQAKYNEPLPNRKVEQLARVLCLQSKVFIRYLEDWGEVPLEAQHQFREYACELADLLGVDCLSGDPEESEPSPIDYCALEAAARRFIAKCEGTAEDGRRAHSRESYAQFKQALGDG